MFAPHPQDLSTRSALAKLNPSAHDLAIYTSDSTNLLHRDNGIGIKPEVSNEGLSNDSSLSNSPEPSDPSIERESYGIGL